MRKHKAMFGIPLLVALSLLIWAAPSTAAKGTTAFSCVEGGSQDFTDSHCAEEVEASSGSFGHSEIEEGLEIPIAFTNQRTGNATKEATPTVLKGKAFGAATEISCATANGTSTIENVAKGVDGVMATESKNVEINLTGCTVSKPAKCAVTEPVKLSAISTTRVGLGTEKNTMGVEFKPSPETFATITYVNKGEESCSLNKKAINLTGSAIATGTLGSDETVSSTSATLEFTPAMTKETLILGGEKAELQSNLTIRPQETKGTTAFSCVEGGVQDFGDSHCAEEVGVGNGEFSHSEIGEGKETAAVLTNEKTANETKEAAHTVIKGKVFGAATEISCATVSGTSTIENVAKGADGVMAVISENVAIKLTNCSVSKPAKCAVAEPIELSSTSTTRVGLGAEKNTMGVEFNSPEKILGTIAYINKGAESCAYNGKPVNLDGSAIATGTRGSDETVSSTSATLEFTPAMTSETLILGGVKAELDSTLTVRKGPKEGKITFQTVPKDRSITLTTTES